MLSQLEQEILKVIAFFDLFSYPLTTLQLWQNLQTKISFQELYDTLHTSVFFSNKLVEKSGRWFLKGKEDIGVIRDERYRFSKHKLDKAKKFARYLKWVPGIESVYVCNSLGYLNSPLESDIDFFIITKNKRIWAVRFFAILLAKLFGRRPQAGKTKDALCLSFFVIDGVDMQEAALNEDIYYKFWMTKLLPLFVRGTATVRFWSRNRWVNKELPQVELICPPQCAVLKNQHSFILGNVVEAILRILQLRLMPKHLKVISQKGTAVIINNKFLKFHDHDRRTEIKKQFMARFAEIAG